MIYQYFRDYATHFNLWSHIRFNTRVNRLYRRLVPDLDNTHEEEGDDRGKWVIESCGSTDFDGSDKMEEFDFVCVGNGHYQDGWIPPIPGLSYVAPPPPSPSWHHASTPSR
jgi:cation diffusion facilitator CzcD-associated flavoprotein CzcO